MNQLTIMGHLGADPEVGFTSTGKKVTTLRLAENQRRKGKDETLWWRVTLWGDQFDKLVSFLKKGSAVVVTGEMPKPEIFTGRDGQPQISLELVAFNISFSPFGRSDKQPQQQGQGSTQREPAYAGKSSTVAQEGSGNFEHSFGGLEQGQSDSEFLADDEIPF